MDNKALQERLCTEPKDSPEETLQFAVAFEESIKGQASHGECKLEIRSKTNPVCAISNPEKVCFRCGAHNSIPQCIPQCETAEEECGKCGTTGNFARCCVKFKKRKSIARRKNSSAVRRVNYLGEDSSEGSYGENTDKIVLTIGGIREPPFVMKGRVKIKNSRQ